jgi:hypothetical protein
MPNKAVSGILKDLSLGVAAVLLFVPLFIFRGVGPLDFWWWMSLDLVLLIGLGSAIDRGFLPALKADLSSGWGNKLVFGAVSAAALYALFQGGSFANPNRPVDGPADRPRRRTLLARFSPEKMAGSIRPRSRLFSRRRPLYVRSRRERKSHACPRGRGLRPVLGSDLRSDRVVASCRRQSHAVGYRRLRPVPVLTDESPDRSTFF